jgi:hypothetical protein
MIFKIKIGQVIGHALTAPWGSLKGEGLEASNECYMSLFFLDLAKFFIFEPWYKGWERLGEYEKQ